MTITMMSLNSTSRSYNISYTGVPFPDRNVTSNDDVNWSSDFQEVKYIDQVTVQTSYGVKTLSNYTYFEATDSSECYAWIDNSTGVVFFISSAHGAYALVLYQLVNDNMPWIQYIGE